MHQPDGSDISQHGGRTTVVPMVFVKCGLGEDEKLGGHQKSTGCLRDFMFSIWWLVLILVSDRSDTAMYGR